jgi:2-oxoglutarate ferredoxin oxidoreductase subunit beta
MSQCSLHVLAVDDDDREFGLSDYEGARARWCPGCGDHSVLTAVQKLLTAEQLKPDETVFVSGIGCSSRFPHYLKAYGFHGIHGRALPVATGIKLHRPDLTVFVTMGDGDCTSIGAGHWIHALRYNPDLTVMMLDNGIYGLTKNQTSPTTPQGLASNTQPRGTVLPPLNPISVALGVTNASFVAGKS